MKYFKARTKRGQQLIAMGSRFEGITLYQVYDSFSADKARAYDWCYEQYLATDDHDAFGICSHNSFQFTCSWVGTLNGENILRIETANNTYIVYLDK